MFRKSIFSSLFILVCTVPINAQNHLPMLPNGNNDGFVVIAHRGASAYAPENTHSAFKLAIEMEAEMIELDLLLSKDGVPIIIHEDPLERTTNSEGNASDYTLEELKEMDAGEWFSEEFVGEPIPTLDEFLSYVDGVIAVNIEIKHEAVTDEAEGGVVDKTLAVVKKYGLEDQVIFSSFDYRVMEHLEKLDPSIPKAILYEARQSGDLLPSQLVEKYKVDAFNCSHGQLSDEWIEDLTSNDIPFFIYTVNDEDLMEKITSQGAAGIFSDKPDVLKRIVENL